MGLMDCDLAIKSQRPRKNQLLGLHSPIGRRKLCVRVRNILNLVSFRSGAKIDGAKGVAGV